MTQSCQTYFKSLINVWDHCCHLERVMKVMIVLLYPRKNGDYKSQTRVAPVQCGKKQSAQQPTPQCENTPLQVKVLHLRSQLGKRTWVLSAKYTTSIKRTIFFLQKISPCDWYIIRSYVIRLLILIYQSINSIWHLKLVMLELVWAASFTVRRFSPVVRPPPKSHKINVRRCQRIKLCYTHLYSFSGLFSILFFLVKYLKIPPLWLYFVACNQLFK